MPYRVKDRDRTWHRDYMRRKRMGVTSGVTSPVSEDVVGPVTPPCKTQLDPTRAYPGRQYAYRVDVQPTFNPAPKPDKKWGHRA